MHMTRILGASALALSFVVGTAGCSTADASSTREQAAPTRPKPDVAALRGGMMGADYNVQPSAAHVQRLAEYSVLGKVVAWHEGPRYSNGVKLSDGSQDVQLFGVMEIETEQDFKSPDGGAKRRFVRVYRGVLPFDEEGDVVPAPKGTFYSALSLGDLKRAIPLGTRVVVIANEIVVKEHRSDEGNVVVIRDWTQDEGSPLLTPYPQGLLFETGDGDYASGGMAEAQEDVAFGQWPASPEFTGSTRAGTFEALRVQLAAKQ